MEDANSDDENPEVDKTPKLKVNAIDAIEYAHPASN
ncbi:unnamed protein product, partial [Allacma fusca]